MMSFWRNIKKESKMKAEQIEEKENKYLSLIEDDLIYHIHRFDTNFVLMDSIKDDVIAFLRKNRSQTSVMNRKINQLFRDTLSQYSWIENYRISFKYEFLDYLGNSNVETCKYLGCDKFFSGIDVTIHYCYEDISQKELNDLKNRVNQEEVDTISDRLCGLLIEKVIENVKCYDLDIVYIEFNEVYRIYERAFEKINTSAKQQMTERVVKKLISNGYNVEYDRDKQQLAFDFGDKQKKE